jgi:hypothetical protein
MQPNFILSKARCGLEWGATQLRIKFAGTAQKVKSKQALRLFFI